MRNLLPVYNLRSAMVDKAGRLISPWNSFFQQFTEAPSAIETITASGTPFLYTPNSSGNAIVYGGTVSSIEIIRGTESIVVANSTANPVIVPLAVKDTLRVQYTVAPAIKFLGD